MRQKTNAHVDKRIALRQAFFARCFHNQQFLGARAISRKTSYHRRTPIAPSIPRRISDGRAPAPPGGRGEAADPLAFSSPLDPFKSCMLLAHVPRSVKQEDWESAFRLCDGATKRSAMLFTRRLLSRSNYLLRATLPERRQRVQTFIFVGLPSTTTCTLWIFGAQPRLVLRCEWLTRLPDMTPFLQTSQYFPML